MATIPLDVTTERLEDAPAIDRLHERAFGPGRFARTAFRLREGVPALLDLSFVARVSAMIVGSNRLTPVRIGASPALLLGPLTVEPAFRSRGIGLVLLEASIDAARSAGHQLVILVGDEPYYGRIGFRRVPLGRVTLPGPVDPDRLLYLDLADHAFEAVEGLAQSFR